MGCVPFAEEEVQASLVVFKALIFAEKLEGNHRGRSARRAD
jgi:hypothetical protein